MVGWVGDWGWEGGGGAWGAMAFNMVWSVWMEVFCLAVEGGENKALSLPASTSTPSQWLLVVTRARVFFTDRLPCKLPPNCDSFPQCEHARISDCHDL